MLWFLSTQPCLSGPKLGSCSSTDTRTRTNQWTPWVLPVWRTTQTTVSFSTCWATTFYGVSAPRCSGRQRCPVIQPSNVYGDEAPIEILQQYDEFDVAGSPAEQSPVWREGPSRAQGLNSKANQLVLTDNTVAQKTAPMFTHLSVILLVWDADIIQGPETFVQRTIPS